jgi:hypothetical protein
LKLNITKLCCCVDDFCKEFMPEYEKRLLVNGNKLIDTDRLNISEIITLMINFHIVKDTEISKLITNGMFVMY